MDTASEAVTTNPRRHPDTSKSTARLRVCHRQPSKSTHRSAPDPLRLTSVFWYPVHLRILIVAISLALSAGRMVGVQDASSAAKKPSASKSKSGKRKPSTKRSTSSPSNPQSTASTSTASHRRATSKTTTKPTQTARRLTQQQPSPERYKEIQQALADKGYFSGSVDGNWGPESVDALKRFQREQNLTDDGKIGSLSLIALGLGPKRTTTNPESTPEKPVQQR